MGPTSPVAPPTAKQPAQASSRHLDPSVHRVPSFVVQRHQISGGFWSNLKDFLTERPAKVPPAKLGAAFTPAQFESSFLDNLKEFFRPAPRITMPAGVSPLDEKWKPEFPSVWQNLRDLFAPPRQAPLKVTSKPVRVKDIWSKDENFGWTQAISLGVHVLVVVLLVVPLFTHILPEVTQANNVAVVPLEISPYVAKLPAGKDKAGGGGGGGDRSPLPPTKGRAPKFSMTQFTPPSPTVKNPNPKLAADPTLLGPPDLKIPNPPLSNYGDPLANIVNNSGGPGGGSGIGTGCCGGIGSGTGGGLGPGEGGGTGGGVFRPGTNGVGYPTCIYCPNPQYSDEARKAKYTGTVVLQAVITADGRAVDIKVVQGPGLGLEEKAIEAVRTWRFKPAYGPNGKPVATISPIEVTFRLL
jgi:protein TonB